MPFEAYAGSVYDTIFHGWSGLTEEMTNMKDVFDAGSEVRIVGASTNLTMSIEGRIAVNSATSVAYDPHNLPPGEVFTVPVEDAVEDEVFFDVSMTFEGQRVENVHLTFEGDKVVNLSAGAGEGTLAGILDTDEGARQLGELGIDMNRGIDRFIDSILFDEKTGDTVHLAVGRAYDVCLPEGEDDNQSAVHTDMIIGMSEDSRIEVDDEVVQWNGTFR